MSRKHNTKHGRSPSRYKKRLAARGLNRAPEMPALESLRKKHKAEGLSVVDDVEVAS